MNRNSKLVALIPGLTSALFTLAGCAATQVKTDHDPSANFADYRTFQVKGGQVINNGRTDPRDTLVRDRVVAAITQELESKGLKPTDQNPDMVIWYTAGAQTVEDIDPDWYGYGPYWGAGYGYDWENQGTLVIDLIDARTNKLVWRSMAAAEEDNFRSAEHITKAVDKSLERFPGPYGQAQ